MILVAEFGGFLANGKEVASHQGIEQCLRPLPPPSFGRPWQPFVIVEQQNEGQGEARAQGLKITAGKGGDVTLIFRRQQRQW
jgi:hypothetical protein